MAGVVIMLKEVIEALHLLGRHVLEADGLDQRPCVLLARLAVVVNPAHQRLVEGQLAAFRVRGLRIALS